MSQVIQVIFKRFCILMLPGKCWVQIFNLFVPRVPDDVRNDVGFAFVSPHFVQSSLFHPCISINGVSVTFTECVGKC